MQLNAVYVQDGEWIVAWLVEMPRVHTQGHTIEEARENLRDALELMLWVEPPHPSPPRDT